MKQIAEFLHELRKSGPFFGVFVPAVQHDLIAVGEEHEEERLNVQTVTYNCALYSRLVVPAGTDHA